MKKIIVFMIVILIMCSFGFSKSIDINLLEDDFIDDNKIKLDNDLNKYVDNYKIIKTKKIKEDFNIDSTLINCVETETGYNCLFNMENDYVIWMDDIILGTIEPDNYYKDKKMYVAEFKISFGGKLHVGKESDVFDLLTNLVAYYKSDVNGTFNDSHDGHHGNITGGATFINDGKNNGAYDYDGVDGYISLDYNTENDINTNFSMSFWIKTNDTGTYKTVYGEYTSGTDYFQVFINDAVPNVLGAFITGNIGLDYIRCTYTINDDSWHHIVWTKTNSYNPSDWKIYIDGVSRALVIQSNTETTSYNVNQNPTIGAQNRAVVPIGYFNGKLDEIGFWNKTLTQPQVTALFNSNQSLSYPFDIDESNFTSINHFDISIDEIVINSPSNVLIANISFNLSKVQNISSFGSLSAKKQTVPITSTIFQELIFNGISVSDTILRTVENIGDIGSVTISPLELNGNLGNNNLLVYIREDGPGSINISNYEFHILSKLTSGNLGNITFNFNELNFKYQNVELTNVSNWTSSYPILTDIFLDVTHRFSATATDTPFCYALNCIKSPIYSRYLSGVSDIGSSGITFINNDSVIGAFNWTLVCGSNNNETITNNVTIFEFSMTDTNSKEVHNKQISNESTNYTNVLTYTSGIHDLVKINNFRMINGSELHISSTSILQSTTGIQTPYIYIETYNGSITSNSNNIKRYMSDNNDIGTIKFYWSLDNVAVNQTFNITLKLNVGVGESINILDESLNIFETTELNTTVGNVPPIAILTTPTNNSNVTGQSQIIYSCVDLNSNGLLSVIKLNDTEIFNGSFSNTNVSINYNIYTEGNYTITLICKDNLNLVSNKTINVQLFKTIIIGPIDQTNINLSETNLIFFLGILTFLYIALFVISFWRDLFIIKVFAIFTGILLGVQLLKLYVPFGVIFIILNVLFLVFIGLDELK